MFNKTLAHSERGSVLISALIISAIIAIFGGVIASRIQSVDKISQLPRIRATMAQIEVQMRVAAYSPSSYTCVYGTGTNYAAGYRCTVIATAFSKLNGIVDDGVVEIDPASLTVDANRHFHGNIRYVPNNVLDPRIQIATRQVDVEVPSEVLQPVNFQCPPDRPLFAGYSDGTNGPTGAAICNALPTTTCAAGEFISSIDPITLVPTCSRAGGLVSCPAGQYISHFEWNNGNRVDVRCLPRKNPFTEMDYNLAVALTVDPFFVSTSPPVSNPAPPPLPTPEIISWTAPNPEPSNICFLQSPVNCDGSFSTCSLPCGGGTMVYSIRTPASNGGAACPHNNGEVMQCNTQACATPTPAPPLAGGACTNDVFYHPCKSTACNVTDFQCLPGEVIERNRAGNVWSGAGGTGNLISWAGGGIATLCIPAGTGSCATAPPPTAPTPNPSLACWIRVNVTAGVPPLYDTSAWDADEQGMVSECQGALTPRGIFICNRSNNGQRVNCGPGMDGTQFNRGNETCMCP